MDGRAGEVERLGARRREMLRGKPLRGRLTWMIGPLTFVATLILVAGVLVVCVDGLWLAIGLTVLAFPAGMLPELFIDLRYSKYRREWEIANEKEDDSV